MDEIDKYFYIVIAKDHLSAQIYCTDSYHHDLDLDFNEEQIMGFLQKNKVNYGIDHQVIRQVSATIGKEAFPLVIAKGLPAINGKDGEITYETNFSTEIVHDSEWDFREVMHIPSVATGQKLATLMNPTVGQEGVTVEGNRIKAFPGKRLIIKTGKNVVYREEDQSFFAVTNGQLTRVGNYIHVHPVFEVHESISMKTGNLDFIGSIIIHGDVPNGFTVKAGGDIKIFGMVEAATVISEGSIYISEGFVGNNIGLIQAKENIKVGYINQGEVCAGKDLFVENSILHSNCLARNQVVCQQGNIIGGTLSAGKSVDVKDIGNHLGTKTEVVFGIDKSIQDRKDQLFSEKEKLQDALTKLEILGKRLEGQSNLQSPRSRISYLRYRNTVHKAETRLIKLEEVLEQLDAQIGSEKEASLLVRNFIHSNVIVSFGKYKQMIRESYHYVAIHLIKNEIVIHPLFN
ncbi:DUF342 domain-containing protein [Oceanobacillus arenosus]|uniref:DUF342 domain-containing protein n=1 Tax=Oceanobacillus arenosus TaxID=1229153 RepID=A0A3D8PTR2_9BACI|nr:FapA family protein [Oceanobacillus arenosus]RDW19506.1 DUF342 domain-containing protein [Oceanobacillus arenosus]